MSHINKSAKKKRTTADIVITTITVIAILIGIILASAGIGCMALALILRRKSFKN